LGIPNREATVMTLRPGKSTGAREARIHPQNRCAKLWTTVFNVA
jgi:hypothetical protein